MSCGRQSEVIQGDRLLEGGSGTGAGIVDEPIAHHQKEKQIVEVLVVELPVVVEVVVVVVAVAAVVAVVVVA